MKVKTCTGAVVISLHCKHSMFTYISVSHKHTAMHCSISQFHANIKHMPPYKLLFFVAHFIYVTLLLERWVARSVCHLHICCHLRFSLDFRKDLYEFDSWIYKDIPVHNLIVLVWNSCVFDVLWLIWDSSGIHLVFIWYSSWTYMGLIWGLSGINLELICDSSGSNLGLILK